MFTPKNQWIIIVSSIVIIIAGTYYYYSPMGSKNSDETIVTNVSHLMLLPRERPIVAYLRQANLLHKQQPFYADVIDGDVLLIFPKIGRAIIYRPSGNLIINAGPFSLQGQGIINSESSHSTSTTRVSAQ